MFEKKKAEYLLGKIKKYAGDALEARMVWDGRKWSIEIEVLKDDFSLNFKDIEINFKRQKDGNP